MSNHRTDPTCPSCGQAYPEGSFICPFCHTKVAKSFFAAPPRWFIVLMLAIITCLAVYAVILAVQVFVYHHF